MKSFLSKSEKYRPVSNQNVRPNTTNYNNKSSFNQHHNHNQNQDNSSSSSSSNLLARTTTKDNYKIESQPNQFQDNHYHWQNSSNPSESKDTTTTTTGTSAKETVDEDGEIELLFHKCFSNKQWQNAVLYTVVKTSLTNPELKTSIKREGDRNYQGRLHRRLSSGISNFYQLLEVHRAESRKGVDPDLMSLSHVLRYNYSRMYYFVQIKKNVAD